MSGDIHLYSARLDVGVEEIARCESLLSPDERARAARLALHDPLRRFVVARGRLREILGHVTGVAPEEVRFRYGRSGKPSLADPSEPRFSVSHSGDLALVALHPWLELGVDVERLRPFPSADRIARRFFTENERRVFGGLPAAEHERAFFICWTRKEACAKALGGDLVPALGRFEVAFGPGEPARLLRIDGDEGAAVRWTLADLGTPPGYVGALAVEGEIARLISSGWPAAG